MPVQITVTKTYNTTNLFEDIKALYKVAGVKGQPVAFIFTDNEVKEEGFLEYINQILMTGEVAGLFAKDELDAIVNDIRPVMKVESPGKICGKALVSGTMMKLLLKSLVTQPWHATLVLCCADGRVSIS